MNRAEMRRMKKAESKRQKTYVLTIDEIDKIRKDERDKVKELYLQKMDETSEEIILMMLAIPVNILVNDYWKKTAIKRIPKFVDDCMSLYQSFEAGAITMSEMIQVVEKYSKVKLLKGSAEKVVKEGY